MKTQFPYAFTKRLYTYSLSFMCTFFIFFCINYNVYGQCPSGLSIVITSSTPTNRPPIQFCTPITITTTVTNSTGNAQSINLRTSFVRDAFDLLCMDDYTQDCSASPTSFSQSFCRNNVSIPANEQVQFRIRIVYEGLTPLPTLGRSVRSDINTLNNCAASLVVPLANVGAAVMGTPGQTTVVNSLPMPISVVTNDLVIRGNVIMNFDHNVDNITFDPNGGFIAMDEGASLTIQSGRTLTLQGTNVFGCKTMWNSIIVESGATLQTGSQGSRATNIMDGFRAIDARNESAIAVRSTIFTDNLTSVYVAPTPGFQKDINFSPFWGSRFEGTGTLRPLANGACDFDRITGFPFTGFDVNNLNRLELLFSPFFVRTRFINLSNGILADETGLFINQLKFENIKTNFANQGGFGVRINGGNSWFLAAGENNPNDLDFTNCSIGFQYQNMGAFRLAQMNSIRMDNTADDNGIGVSALANFNMDAYIYAMNIRARAGIVSLWNQPNIGEINDNNIEATYPTNPSVSSGIFAFENSTTGNWNIFQNIISIENAQTGMQFNSGNGAIITDNGFDIQPFSPSDSKGFQSGGSSNFNLSCNNFTIAGNTSSFFDRSSIYMVNGTGSTYSCNNTFGTQNGLNVIGDARPFTMSGNRFNNHAYGLLLNNSSFIGVQTNRGNRWAGPFGVRGAQHFDPLIGNVLLSRFDVGNPNAPIMPTFSPSNWFAPIGGIDFTCANTNTCPNGSPAGLVGGGGDNENYYRSAISDTPMETAYGEEMKWTAQRNAYGRLRDNPSHQNSRDITAFVGRMRESSTGQLYQIEKSMKNIHTIGEEFREVLTRNMKTTKSLATEIADLEVKIVSATTQDKVIFTAQKKEKNATMLRLSRESMPYQQTIARKKLQEVERLIRDNERVRTQILPESNEKDVNKIYLETIAQGKLKLNDEQKVIVKTIAYQCPLQGGNAVFAARSLYALVENVSFNDLDLCKSREIIAELKVKRESQYKISPNPATDVLTLSQMSKKAESGEWLIFDAVGKLILTKKVTDNDVETTINIQDLSEGVYLVSFVVNGQKRFTQKLVKIKSN